MSSGLQSSQKQPIAIVGIAADLPSGDYAPTNLDYKKFMEFLLNKGEAYEEIPKERFNVKSWAGETLGRVIATRGAFLKEVGSFDHVEFGISGKDARAMAPSIRKLVELSFLALLDAGIEYRGRDVGCYAAGTAFDILSITEPDEFEAKGSFAGTPSMMANKISYHLDLQGPSVPMDTACSSSLTALHLAVQAIRAGECESAVVAGCQLNLRLADFIQYSQASVLARDGKCKPFDAGADGFSRGEGAVVVVLKPYEDAIRDGDYIYGNILGSGINSCGGVAPVYAPVGDAQAEAMRKAYLGIDRNPREVDFVEMHATGTSAGDPVESEWIGQYFNREEELMIGSVKGNIGHLEITAFLASLCKVCAILETGVVPPNVNLTKRNPAIKWGQYKFQVPLEATPIKPRSASGKLLVSMSSFGIGGANGHVVVESPSPLGEPQVVGQVATGPVLLVAAGLSPRSTTAIADSLGGVVNSQPENLAAVSAIYGRRARQMTWRSFAIARPGQQAQALQFPAPALSPRIKPPMVFLFSGQGPQHINMGRQLFKKFPVFRDTIMELDACHREMTGHSLSELVGLFEDVTPIETLPSIWPISVILPSLAMVQMALFDLLVSFGLRPDMVIGHSAGETTLLYASGAGSKVMAMEIAIARGKAMTLVEKANGTMAALTCTPAQAQAIIHAVTRMDAKKGILEIACYNAHEAVAIAGHTYLVEKAVELAGTRGILARKIQTGVAVHSSLMEVCENYYRSLVSEVYARHPGAHTPVVPTYSTATGDLKTDEFTEEYFWQNSRNAVLFTQAIGSILKTHPNACFVEVSPHPVLSTYLQELGVPMGSVVCPMRRSKKLEEFHEESKLLEALGQLVVMGHNSVNFCILNSQKVISHSLTIPPYPFAKKFVPYLSEHSRVAQKQFGVRNGPLNHVDLRINKLTHPEIAQHLINDEPIMPAAGYLEMALEAGAKVLWNVKFHTILSMSAESPVPVEVEIDRMHWAVKSRGGSANLMEGTTVASRLHADGFMSKVPVDNLDNLNIEAIRSRCQPRSMENFYDALKHFAQYGPVFRRITEFNMGIDEAVLTIRGGAADLPGFDNFVIHPAILDACIHVVVHPSFTRNPDHKVYYLPARVETFMVHERLSQGTFPGTVYAHALLREWRPSELVTDVTVVDSTGTRLCTMSGLVVERHYNTLPRTISKRFNVAYQPFGISPRMRVPKEHSVPHGADPEDALFRIARAALNHLTGVCGKKTIRILALDYGSGELNRQLCSSFEKIVQSGSSVAYFVSMKDSASLAQQALPRFCRPVSLDFSEPLDKQGLPQASFDAVISLQALGSRDSLDQDLHQLNSLLLPGGFLLLAEPAQRSSNTPSSSLHTCSEWLSLFSSLGMRTTTHCVKADTSPFVVLEGQRQSISFAPSSGAPKEDILFISYAVGREMEIQRILKGLDIDNPAKVWFTATDPMDADGGRGFTRSVRREFPLWDIGFAIFGFQCPRAEQTNIINRLLATPGMEREVYVDEEYQVFVPRFHEGPTVSPGTKIEHGDSTELSPSDVQVTVVASSPSDAGFYGVVGRVTNVGDESDASLVDSLITTVVKSAPTKHLRVHRGAVTPVPDELDAQVVASVIPVLLIGGLAIGAGALRDPSRMKSGRIVVTHSDTATGQALAWFLHTLGLQPIGVGSKASPFELSKLALRNGDLVLSGYSHDNQLLTSFVAEGTRVFSWATSINLAHTLSSDPWLVGDTLQAAVDISSEFELPNVKVLSGPSTESSSASSKLFKADEAYLLVGGVGSLGMHIALWMYEKGARHIVLTSRSGRQSLERANDILAMRMLSYLETRPDLDLKIEASDATSLEALQKTLAGVTRPIAGCMLLPAILIDRGFFSQDASSFKTVFDSKLRVFETVEAGLDIAKLDFLVTFSSVVTFGNAGQTNYASANTVVEGKTAQYRNAFSIITPAITDTIAMVGRADLDFQVHGRHLLAWSYSARELCNCIEDGLFKLQDEPFKLYVPDLDWELVEKHLGPSPLYEHLIPRSASVQSAPSGESAADALRNVVLQFLDVDPADFSVDVPFTSYGIDSLSAGRLSYALRPFITISQIQLLGDISLADVERRIEAESQTEDISNPGSAHDVQKDGGSGVQQPVVKIADYEGDTPLILLHGASGSILPFMSMKQNFRTSLWALQTTPETPVHSIRAIGQYYYEHIKAARPHGPYRLAGFCGTSTIIFMVARIMQDNADEVVQLAILDHFPLLWASPLVKPDEESINLRTSGPAVLKRTMDTMLQLYRIDGAPSRVRTAEDFDKLMDGHEVSPQVRGWMDTITSLLAATYEFMFELLPADEPYSVDALREAFAGWLRELRVPITMYMASGGYIALIPEEEKQGWEQYSIHSVYPDAKVMGFECSHFQILDLPELAEEVQRGW
ncbi:putative polyketide synthase [Serpula lacrymans var. lacrymans S7.9]|uniref:Putative polyketide synthase n=1 Tax=Serpula lacrymans var. lacrymans (strain S7.9) TaxID=578457 RepID=F8NQ93_SERL9|nr:putative polyketide synthase [Serpula lacrymans var. lacrymans S7.9]EGO26553.1 putative polyketide synthase [Serpula lacrymans var. lacrymans S7.9]